MRWTCFVGRYCNHLGGMEAAPVEMLNLPINPGADSLGLEEERGWAG